MEAKEADRFSISQVWDVAGTVIMSDEFQRDIDSFMNTNCSCFELEIAMLRACCCPQKNVATTIGIRPTNGASGGTASRDSINQASMMKIQCDLGASTQTVWERKAPAPTTGGQAPTPATGGQAPAPAVAVA